MKTHNRFMCLDPQPPETFSRLTAVSEVFPDNPRAILAIVAELDDGRYAVWAEIMGQNRPTGHACSPTEAFTTLDEALAGQPSLIVDLLEYAYPDATA